MRWRLVNSIVRQTGGFNFIRICVMFTTKEEQRGVILFSVEKSFWSLPGPFVYSNQGQAVWLPSGVVLLHYNAWTHTTTHILNKLTKLGWTVLEHQPYSPDLSPCDFHIFGSLRKALKSHCFTRKGHGHYSKLVLISTEHFLHTKKYSSLGEPVVHVIGVTYCFLRLNREPVSPVLPEHSIRDVDRYHGDPATPEVALGECEQQDRIPAVSISASDIPEKRRGRYVSEFAGNDHGPGMITLLQNTGEFSLVLHLYFLCFVLK
ncbi:hypothetical protein AVEN_146028-1 [Araneus ventricosus]|uniref:Mariner Mos1 transposase n=1 Tax=Araneus ventricosus TaxID=182803 RepID=A0A4Y2GW03_ARAVE|nr:hypothetical protein AVEN_146028-1 [Araneus ventricosus]